MHKNSRGDSSAKMVAEQLQLQEAFADDFSEGLVALTGMGFAEPEARSALRDNDNDLAAAVAALTSTEDSAAPLGVRKRVKESV